MLKTTLTKTQQLRALIDPSQLDFIMEAHNGLSARIAEEAGFRGVWASGLSISSALGVRDNNEASWTQVLEVAEFMADATTIPILIDGDTGFGNFNNFRRMVRKLEQRGIAGVCIEDKLFPKTNSFLRGDAQPLAAIDEFCGKINAGKEAQADPDFVIVARTEALIAGWGLAEAVRRAEAYRLAGADAIVVHSAQSKPDEILEFLDVWANRHPVILIPTKYYTTPTQVFAERNVATVIWANHLMRGALTAMQTIAARIHRDRSVMGVEESIAPLREVFRLQGDDELRIAEDRFLASAPRRTAVVLAATRGGPALHALTHSIPKTMLRVGGVTLLDRLCDNLAALTVRDVTVVAGYAKEAIARPGVRRVDNDQWDNTGELASLALAAESLKGPCVVAFGDLLCRRHILQELFDDEAALVIAADRRIRRDRVERDRPRDLIKLSAAQPHAFLDEDVTVASAVFSQEFTEFDAEWTGLLKCSPQGALWVCEAVQSLSLQPNFAQLALVDLLARLVADGRAIKVHLVSGDWTSIESVVDLADASNL
jgi:phosphoenolpyruvate phosphomutase